MSAKQEKRLRKIAKGLAVTLDQAGKRIYQRNLIAKEIPSSQDRTSSITPSVITRTLENSPDSLRGIIRSIKKDSKKVIR